MNGEAHDIAANITIVVCVPAAFYLLPEEVATMVIPGLVIGKYCNPDVRDQADMTNVGEQMVYEHFGEEAGTLWQIYWWPLARLIPHRHWASHFAGPATLIAALYLFAPVLGLVAFVRPEYLLNAAILAGWTVPGWYVQDVVHLILDKFGIRW